MALAPRYLAKSLHQCRSKSELCYQPKGKAFIFCDKLWLSSIVRFHPANDFERHSHPHMLQKAIVAHDILDELISGRSATGRHPVRSNTIRKPTGRDDFQTITVYCQLYICATEKVVAVYQGIYNAFSQYVGWIRRLLDPPAILNCGGDSDISPQKIECLFQRPFSTNFPSVGKYPPAKPGALLCEPLKAA